MPQANGQAAAIKERSRRVDIEEVLGDIEAPQLPTGQHLIDILFQVGPAKGEAPLTEGDLEPWERRRGIELAPWQAELIVRLSGEYLMYAQKAREWNAIPPWPPAVKMWKYVRDQKNGLGLKAALKEKVKEQPNNGPRKRHRNPPAG